MPSTSTSSRIPERTRNLVAFLAVLATTVESPALERLHLTDPSKAEATDWDAIRHELVGQRLLAMDYYSGGHLTHGYRHNVSSWLFEAHSYTGRPGHASAGHRRGAPPGP